MASNINPRSIDDGQRSALISALATQGGTKNTDFRRIYNKDGSIKSLADLVEYAEEEFPCPVKSLEFDNDHFLTGITFHGDRTGFVYLMQAENGLIKIGITKHLHKRLGSISNGPIDVTLLAHGFSYDAVALESDLHAQYSHCRVRGEWFRLTSDEIQEAIELVNA